MKKPSLLFFVFCLAAGLLSAQQTFYSPANRNGYEVKLVQQSSGEVIVEFSLLGFEMKTVSVDNKSYTRIILNEAAPVQKKGAPDLFQCVAPVIIPDEGTPELSIISQDFEEYNNISMLPSKGVITRDIDPSGVPYTFSDIYTKNAFYPQSGGNLSQPYIFRDLRGTNIHFTPFQYNPVTKTLRVNKTIRVKVKTKTSVPGINQLKRIQDVQKIDEDFNLMYKNHFLNFSPGKYTSVAERGRMLIISYGSYITEMTPFKNWKNRSGYRTEIVDIATIGNNATSIKNYITNYYNTKGLTFVLFVGDAQHITPITSGVGGPSDNAYGYITGNDHYPEIYIGRFSAESTTDVNVQVTRTLNYEKTPNQSSDWLNRTLGIGSDQGPGDDNEYDYQHIRNLQTDLMNYQYTVKYEMFDGDQGGLDASGNVTASMVGTQVNGGVGLINYIGHGADDSWVTSGFSVSNMSTLTNTGQWPFIWSVACVNGNFQNQTCFAEGWLRARNASNQPTGAVAALMSTINQSWNSPMAGQDEMIDVLTEQFPGNIKRTFGALSMAGCMKMIDEYSTDGQNMADTWTVFGDPSLMVRTDTPKTMTVNHPATAVIGLTSMQITCPAPGAYATLSINDTILASGALSGGSVTLNFAALTAVDTINIVVTAYNYIPYQNEIPVISSNTPYVVHLSHAINDASGNNNGNADMGESILLSMNLKNSGMQNASNVSATISCGSSMVNITDNTNTYGQINAGATVAGNNAYAFTVGNNVDDATDISFAVVATDGTSTWNSSFPLTLYAPKLSIGNMTLSEVTGNGNGKADPGETISVSIANSNIGHVAYQSAGSQLSTANTYANITTNSQSLGTLDPSENGTATFTIAISASTPAGTSINITNTLGSGYYAVTKNFSIKVGQADEDFESNDFTQYTWTFSGTTPWVTSNQAPYEGTYCSKSGTITDSQTSEMSVTMAAGVADSISFYKKVSCEAGSEYGSKWDYLEFFIDGTSKEWWDGIHDWSRVVYPVAAGSRTYKWVYGKDDVYAGGDDCAWVDFIVFPPLPSTVGCEDMTIATFSLYPNPSTDMITIDLPGAISNDARFEIYTSDGKLVGSNLISAEKTSVNMTGLSAGTYYIKVINNGKIQTRMIFLGK